MANPRQAPEAQPVEVPTPRIVPARPPGAPRGDEATAAQLLATLLEYRWTVLGLAGTVVAVALLYVATAPRTYEASVLVQVEEERRVGAAFHDLGGLFDSRAPTEGEMQLMRSRRLVETVVDEQGLDVEVRPVTLPVVGAALARRWDGPAPAPPRFGLARFAWGGERLRLEELSVSRGLEGQPLTLTALEGGRYRVAARDGTPLAEGEVGGAATGTDGERSVALSVAELVARPGTSFLVTRLPRAEAVERLQAALVVASQGQHTGLVRISLSGPEPARLAATLDSLAARYVRQNMERTSAEAAKTLRVLEAQLPVLRGNLERAEVALNRYRSANGTVDLSREGALLLERVGELDRSAAEVELRRAELHRYTERHPDLPALQERAARLSAQRAQLEARLRALPDTELHAARLSRQVRVATELYMLVANRAEELRIVKSGWIGNVRVLEEAAVPHRPKSPRPGPALALAALLGVLGGVAAALTRRQLDPGARHPEEIEAGTGLPVLATVPRSARQAALAHRAGRRGPLCALAVAAPDDPAVEDLRALRSSVLFALGRAPNAVVAVGGLAAGAGKSFVSVNLAHLLAAAGGRVLLLDGDLRRGELHRQFGAEAEPGLADVLRGTHGLDAALRTTGQPDLDLLPAGGLAGSNGELLAGARLPELLAELGRRYKAIVVDTPPVLSVNDSALFGRHAGVNLVVVRAGKHSVRDLAVAERRLAQSGVTVTGVVLNGVARRGAWYGGARELRWRGPAPA
jgi:tyrosine-protein kinase Etk/Wzc